MKMVVLGIGNPILTDDCVGIKVAQQIKQEKPGLEVLETCESGLSLLDHIVDCDRLVIIDSIRYPDEEPGELFEVDYHDLKPKPDFSVTHGMDLAAAFEIGKGLGYKMPESVSIYAINVLDNTNFSEVCTVELQKKIPLIAKEIIEKEKL